MKKLGNNLRNNAHVVLSVPAILCFITFMTNLAQIVREGNIDGNELNQLLMTADGFEAVVISVIILVLKDKNK